MDSGGPRALCAADIRVYLRSKLKVSSEHLEPDMTEAHTQGGAQVGLWSYVWKTT